MTGGLDRDALAYDRVADTYERGRPGYPVAAVSAVVDHLAVGSGPVVDLAAGTGKFTRALASELPGVIAIEPVAAMVRHARTQAGVPAAQAVAGALPFPTGVLAGMTVAQAFQWFAPGDVDEIARVLREGASLAVIANRRLPEGVWADIDRELSSRRVRPRRQVDVPAALAASPRFTAIDRRVFPWTRVIDAATLIDHIASMSWVAGLDATVRGDVDERIHAIAHAAGPEIELAYETEVVTARRLGAEA